MQFSYHPDASDTILEVDGELYNYLFKVRRHKSQETFDFRNLKDDNLYTYEVIEISKKTAKLSILKSQNLPMVPKSYLHIGWCIIDPKNIEKTLPFLNELGVCKISFIYSDYSQKNFKMNYDRYEKIIINSCMQCGRSDMMKFEEYKNIKEFLSIYPQSLILDFSDNYISYNTSFDTIIVGNEAGFSENERKMFTKTNIVGLPNNIILRSETATTLVSSIKTLHY